MGVEIPLNLFVNLKQHGYSEPPSNAFHPRSGLLNGIICRSLKSCVRAVCYANGEGVPRDYAEALKCWGNFWQD